MTVRAVIYIAIASTAVACGKDAPTGPDRSPNFVRLESDPNDYIGGGRFLEYTQANAVLIVSAAGNTVGVRIDGDESWSGDFVAPQGTDVKEGTYTGATRYPFNAKTAPGVSWSGEGRGCNTLTGSFTVDNLSYVNQVLDALDLRFEQHCEGQAPALRGTIHWRADDPTKPPPPVDPAPADLWKPDPASVPALGTYVLLSSDPGEPIGQGQFRVYAPPSAPVSVSNTGTKITVNAGGYIGTFISMLGVVPLRAGYYPSVQRAPFHNPVRGGLDWSGNGRGCNQLAGWFAIDRIVYTGTTMTALEMRFEQRCEGATTALHGAIRWSAP